MSNSLNLTPLTRPSWHRLLQLLRRADRNALLRKQKPPKLAHSVNNYQSLIVIFRNAFQLSRDFDRRYYSIRRHFARDFPFVVLIKTRCADFNRSEVQIDTTVANRSVECIYAALTYGATRSKRRDSASRGISYAAPGRNLPLTAGIRWSSES